MITVQISSPYSAVRFTDYKSLRLFIPAVKLLGYYHSSALRTDKPAADEGASTIAGETRSPSKSGHRDTQDQTPFAMTPSPCLTVPFRAAYKHNWKTW